MTLFQSAKNASLQQFDVIAVRPLTEKHFQAACATLDVDVISLDLASYLNPSIHPPDLHMLPTHPMNVLGCRRLPFKLKFATVGQALQRGVHFEISLASPLRGSSLILTYAAKSNPLHRLFFPIQIQTVESSG